MAEPSMDPELDADIDTLTQELLLAASKHDVSALKDLLRQENASVNVQDSETGYSPLHAAVLACEQDDMHEDGDDGGEGEEDGDNAVDMQKAESTIRFLFENGAIWNDLDADGDTPGDIAWRLGSRGTQLYQIIVEAGVRAELLLNRLDEYQLLNNGDSDEDMADGDNESDAEDSGHYEIVDLEEIDEDSEEATNGIIQAINNAAAATTAARMLAVASDKSRGTSEQATSADYLKGTLSFQVGRILDAEGNGVMMDWETLIMQRTAEALLPVPGLCVLNLGHGMGIIDEFIQTKRPAAHHIIEAHPAVLARMDETGWGNTSSSTNGGSKKENVTVHAGRWQDVLPQLAQRADAPLFDAIYFDTFAEDYKAFRAFFSEYVVTLLKPGGKWSFFHGMGADRQICYDVYTRVVEMDLLDAGFDVEWETFDAAAHRQDDQNDQEDETWKGVKRRYWDLEKYRLPLCAFLE